MIIRKLLIVVVLMVAFIFESEADWPMLSNGVILNPSDPTQAYSNIAFEGELFDMLQGNLWKWSFTGGLAFAKNRHQLSVDVPIVRSEYPGVENLTGIGDISIRYHYVAYRSDIQIKTHASSALYLDLSIPTGNTFEGHGAGVPVVMPGLVFAYKPVSQIAIYPEIMYLHSFGEANSDWGGGYPGSIPDDPGSEKNKIRLLQALVLFNVEFSEAWLGLAPAYSYSFTSKESTLSIRPEIGKLFGDKVSLKLSGSFFVAGRKRLNSWTYFDVRYYF